MRIFIGEAWEYVCDKRGRVEISFEPRDLWIGVYISETGIFIYPLPMIAIRISRGRREMIA